MINCFCFVVVLVSISIHKMQLKTDFVGESHI